MEKGIFNSPQMRILGALVMLMVLIALSSYAALNFEKIKYTNPMPASITVTGKGEVSAVPDIGQFSFTVEANGADASTAQSLSGTKINDIIAYLTEQGIEKKDIKTQDYNLFPKYRYEERFCAGNSYCPPTEPIPDGFTVSQTVTVKVRAIDSAGNIIGGVGDKGATNISGLSFTIDDPEALQAEARALAIKDAQEKAVALANNLNVRVVKLVGYYEDSGMYQPYYMDAKMESMGGDSVSAMPSPELPVGEQDTTIQVNVTYEVK